MFLWSAATILDSLEQYLPRTAALLDEIGRDFRPQTLTRLYPLCDNISVDYAVLEKAGAAGRVAGVLCDMGWNDVGSWNALYELLPHDEDGNAVRGQAWLLDARGNYLDVLGVPGSKGSKKMVAAIGVENLVVVDCHDALLIARRDRAQDVSKVVAWLEKHKREKLL